MVLFFAASFSLWTGREALFVVPFPVACLPTRKAGKANSQEAKQPTFTATTPAAPAGSQAGPKGACLGACWGAKHQRQQSRYQNLHGSTCKPFPQRAGITNHLDHSIQVRQACLVLLSRLFLAMDRSSGHLRASKPPSFRRDASIRGVVLCRLFLAMDRSRGPLRSPIPGGMPSNPQGRQSKLARSQATNLHSNDPSGPSRLPGRPQGGLPGSLLGGKAPETTKPVQKLHGSTEQPSKAIIHKIFARAAQHKPRQTQTLNANDSSLNV